MECDADSSDSDWPHVVVIGAGFAGLNAARGLAKQRLRVTVVDRWNHHLFQPLLYQIAMAGLSPAEIAYPIRAVLRNQRNARVLLGDVQMVDLAARRVRLTDGASIDYDYVVLAPGAETNYFGHDTTWAAHTLPLKSVDDALEIRKRVLLAFEAAEREADPASRQRLLTFVIIGGGPTGVEVAGALAELSRHVLARDFRVVRPETARVVLIEMQSRLLPGGFDARLAERAVVQLQQLGVEVQLGTRVIDIDESGVKLEHERLESATVLWTAGVKANQLCASLGVPLDKAGRVIVERDCSIPGHPTAFVVGDAAHYDIPGGVVPGLAPAAMQQGRYVARRIGYQLRGIASEPYEYRDKGVMATIGRSRAIAQTGNLRLSGFVAWVAWLLVHVWYLIGFRNRVAVMLNWLWSYMTYRRGARLITGTVAPQEISKLMAWSEKAATLEPREVSHGSAAAPVAQ
jgi:NADH dehydrogenase